MQPSFYVAISGQVALQKRLDTVANNFANVSTAGYRSEDVKFDTIVSSLTPEPVSFASAQGTYVSRKTGGLTQTGNVLDVGVQGEGWLGIQTPSGIAYTRDGRMKMLLTGELQTLDGYSVLDAGGSPIVLDPQGGAVQIGQNGAITQNKRSLGAIGLYKIPEMAKLKRMDNSAVIPDVAAEQVVDFTNDGIVQGFSEGSNVNPVLEMTKLLSVQRNFEAVSNSLNTVETSLMDAIKTLGSPV
jgi:flagellar basal-body rod protein FlgF